LLCARGTRLGAATQTALAAAAVIGREFGFDVLRGVAALSDSSLLDALDLALASHLLEETEGGYRFQHWLIRKALYDVLSRTRRARLHGLAAETIESVYTRRPGGLEPYIADLAYSAAISTRLAQGRLAEAEQFCRRLEEAAENYASRTWIAMARQSRGELAAAQGDLDRAIMCYTEAGEAFSAAGNQYEAARCLEALARWREARGAADDLPVAWTVRVEARRIFEELGAIAIGSSETA
jgi:tetratricopeptide (TPR) repeat protein